MIEELLFLAALVLLLVLLAVIALISVNSSIKKRDKFESRLNEAISPVARPTNFAEEQISLAKTVSQADIIKQRAANLINVDLQQAETYPIKWWLVPILSLAISYFFVFLAIHPLHSITVYIYLFGWPIAWIIVTKFIFTWFNNRRNAALLEQFPDALSTIVRCVRVGIPMGEALRTVANDSQEPTKAEFLILADKVSIGIPLDVALRELSARIKLTEYQFFSTALTLQARSGGGITQTLETLAEVIRKRVGLKQRGYALTSEARTSALILSCLPFVAGGAIFIMQRDYISLLFTTSGGQACLGAAILMMMIGMGIIQYMISSVLK
jgi:tight adherence protein B